MNKKSALVSVSALTMVLSTSAHAALYDRGNGMIYDSDQNITWLKDANYAATQFSASSGTLGDEDGMMTWTEAQAWVAALEFGGYDDWRLPAFKIPGDQLNKSYSVNGTTDRGYNVDTSHSEFAYLWYEILGNTSLYNLDGTKNWVSSGSRPVDQFPINTSADGATFINFQWDQVHALGLRYSNVYGTVWCFEDGYQGYDGINDLKFFAWAVRDGDVASATPAVNEPPDVSLSVTQNGGVNIARVTKTGGNIVVQAVATDPNSGDSLTLEWSTAPASLVDLDVDEGSFTFDPSALASGVYQVSARVYDNASVPLSGYQHILIHVVETVPTLSSSIDSDDDGINDAAEGMVDTDFDGIPDYLDNIAQSNILPVVPGNNSRYLGRTEAGMRVTLGRYALQREKGGMQLSDADFQAVDALKSDPDYATPGGIFDFEVHDLPNVGQTARFVIPQRSAIPANPVYRKFTAVHGWSTFVEDNNNKLYSTSGEQGLCPLPGDARWLPGLTAGHWCVQIEIEDGGANDEDGMANGVIVDPGGVGTSNASTATAASGGSGAVNLMFLLLALYMAGQIRRRRLAVVH